MAMVLYESISEIVTLRNKFYVDVAGTPTLTDPTTVSLTVTSPSQAVTVYTYAAAQIIRNSVGDYQKDIACSEAGTWTYQWEGTGAASDVVAGTWAVFETALGRLYATVETLKSRMGITTTADDFEVHAACFAASRAVEQYCERHFWRTPTATVRTFVPDDGYLLRLPEWNDLVSIAFLKTDSTGDGVYETTWATTDYQLLTGIDGYNPSAAPEQRPYTRIEAVGALRFPVVVGAGTRRNRVEITGVFGWPAVPAGVKECAKIIAADTFALKNAPHGVVGTEFGPVRVRPNTIAAAYADPYRRNGGVLVA